jgi:hypothetical protein
MTYSKLTDLRDIFLLNNQLAIAGKKRIDHYLTKNDAEGLAHLLRHHTEEEIEDAETWHRDEVDYFLEYFSILSLGHITGYLSYNDLEEAKVDVAFYLGNAAIKRYYYVNYPLLLPQFLLETILEERPLTNLKKNKKRDLLFHQFHTLNQTIDNNDVNQFLWFMDGGINDGMDVDDLR